METGYLIRLTDVHKNYNPPSGPVPVLKGADFSLEQGKTAAVTGPSGSGKTTLLNLIGALDTPDRGEIVFNGKQISAFTKQQLIQFRMKHIGIVFQQHLLLPQCTALENILIPSLPLKTPAAEAMKRAEALLKETGLYERRHFFPAQLSGGECQRVAVARALINDPLLILADEPTGSLDREKALTVINLLKQSSVEKKKTLIIVTHAGFVAQQMQYRYTLADGRLADTGEQQHGL